MSITIYKSEQPTEKPDPLDALAERIEDGLKLLFETDFVDGGTGSVGSWWCEQVLEWVHSITPILKQANVGAAAKWETLTDVPSKHNVCDGATVREVLRQRIAHLDAARSVGVLNACKQHLADAVARAKEERKDACKRTPKCR